MKQFLPIAMVLVLLSGAAAWAGDWEDGYAAYERKDYVTAVKKWRSVAELGESRGQSILGSMYAYGQGVKQDYAESARWYRLAAVQGDAKAQFKLGFMYANGQGVSRDTVRAAMWFKVGAEAGHPDAQKSLDAAEQKMTDKEIAEARSLARDCLRRNFKSCD